MIVYNNNTLNNLNQFIKDAIPTNKEKSVFIKNDIIKIRGIIYVSDQYNILGNTDTIKALLK